VTVTLPREDHAFLGALRIVRILREAGHEAYVVGGAVRDLVMRRSPREYDIATSAKPTEVQALFRRTVAVGAQFGVIRVRIGHQDYEVATYRVDLGYSDGRRPDAVRFASLREDVKRRDFTMNGLALDVETGEVIDLVEGMSDIEAQLIRAIGDPFERFAEDRLRPLRAVRFAAQLGFRIEERTWHAVREAAAGVRQVSIERVRDEVQKMLDSEAPGRGFLLLGESGILREVFPDLDRAVAETRQAIAEVLDRLRGANASTLWAALAWPIHDARAFARRLHLSGAMREAIAGILETARAIQGLQGPDVAVEKRVLRSRWARDAMRLLEARGEALGEDAPAVARARSRLAEWTEQDLFPPRLLSGEDLLSLGLPQGPLIGETLNALEDASLRGEVRTREDALSWLASRLRAVPDPAGRAPEKDPSARKTGPAR